MPVVVMPQALLCGLLTPRHAMVGWLRAFSDILPLSYAVEALTEANDHGGPTGVMWRDIAIVLVAVLIALCLGAMTLKRRST